MKHKCFVTTNPYLAGEWDRQKNKGLRPEDFTNVSRRFVWWICAWGHSWQDRICNRVNGHGCPYDCGRRLRHNFQNLATVKPDLAAEWDYEKNDFLSPEDVSINTSIKAWWHCKNGHNWKAKVSSRLQGIACPKCMKDSDDNISFKSM